MCQPMRLQAGTLHAGPAYVALSNMYTECQSSLSVCVCVQLTSLSAQDLAGSLQQKLSACFILPKMLCARG